MKYLLKFSPATGWLCKAENLKCEFCQDFLLERTKAWHLDIPDCFACEVCFKEKREAGLLWNIGHAKPITIVCDLPVELQEDPEMEW